MGGSSTTVEAAEPTEEERNLTRRQVELAEAQLEAIQKQTQFQEKQFEAVAPLLEIQTRQAEIQNELLESSGDERALLQQQLDIQSSQLELGLGQLERNLSLDPLRAEFERQTIEFGREQLELARAGIPLQQEQLELQKQLGEQQLALSVEQVERARSLAPVQDEVLQLQLESLRRGGAASEQEIELISQATGAALEAGESDVTRFEREGLERLREELAPALGLRPSDSPILDRGARIAEEGLRLKGQLSAGLRSNEATARLNFPLARENLLFQQSQFQQNLAQATQQFQQQLSQQAFTNRLNLSQLGGGIGSPNFTGLGFNNAGAVAQAGQFGLGLATGFNVPFPQQERGSTSTTRGSAFGGLISGVGAVGGLLSGLGAIGVGGSSHEFKKDKREIDEEAVLEGVSRLPVETWRYKEGLGLDSDKPHVGTYAEDFQNTFGLGDGKTLDFIDTTGVLMASVKALDKKVKVLEMERGKNGTFGLAA